jgi:hypothetical protein
VDGSGMVVDSPVAGGESNEASLAVAANLPLTWVSCFNGPCLHWATGCLHTQAVISDGPLHDSQKKDGPLHVSLRPIPLLAPPTRPRVASSPGSQSPPRLSSCRAAAVHVAWLRD